MTKPKKLSASDWFEQKKAKLQEDIAYHEKEQLEENNRVAARNLWLKQLRQSLV